MLQLIRMAEHFHQEIFSFWLTICVLYRYGIAERQVIELPTEDTTELLKNLFLFTI